MVCALGDGLERRMGGGPGYVSLVGVEMKVGGHCFAGGPFFLSSIGRAEGMGFMMSELECRVMTVGNWESG
jgi:hypothetical protein